MEIIHEPFRPLRHKREIDFNLGPSGVKLTEAMIPSDRFPSMAQLYIIFTDLKNLMKSQVSDKMAASEDEEDMDDDEPVGQVIPLTQMIKAEPVDLDNTIPVFTERLPSPILEEEIIQSGANNSVNLNSFEKLRLEEVVQLFRYRIKNNHLGQLPYLPPKWNGNCL